MVEYLKIPKEKLETLQANNNQLKKTIEKGTQTKIEINQELCEIAISETKHMKDPLGAWVARDIIKAIGRGFEPEMALKLLEGFELEIIDLKDFVGKKKNALKRIKGRIIGTKGKAKNTIAETTDTDIVIYGKTVAIIGAHENVQKAARAIEMLASGSRHNPVYKMLGA